MNISKLFLTTLTAVAITGCSTSAKQAQQARAYQDIDGSVKEIIFTDHTLNEQQLNDIRVARGQAANKTGVIGEIYALRDGSGLLLTDGTKSFSPYESTEMRMLANAKALIYMNLVEVTWGMPNFPRRTECVKILTEKTVSI